ncbi:MAG: methylornithine synthase PylB [Deltaproteobacteria bacterium]|jgi:methylornithine synthase|nr:methylornithine synthase PylB [Deltaproteobacteria bacterium]
MTASNAVPEGPAPAASLVPGQIPPDVTGRVPGQLRTIFPETLPGSDPALFLALRQAAHGAAALLPSATALPPPVPAHGTSGGYRGLLRKALSRARLDLEETALLLSPGGMEEREALFAAAREARERAWGGRVFTYGFIYLSTYCRNDCRFCAWRSSNGSEPRYRKTREEILEASAALAGDGVSLVDLTTGEDPETDSPWYAAGLADLIRAVRAETGLPVMISPGLVSGRALRLFAEAGALFYACYQETHCPELFARLRAGQDYGARWRAKLKARRAGLLVEEGVLCGVGESARDLAESVMAMRALGAAQVRAMAFVPPAHDGPGPFLDDPAQDTARERELLMIAAMRLAFPDALIPASLDVEGLAGLAPRLDSGANVVTSLVPAGLGLAGVAQGSLDIQNRGRSLASVLPVLSGLGLTHGTPAEYLKNAGRGLAGM